MKYKIKKGLISQKINNKTTIFDGEHSLLHTFNQTASEIFEKLKKGNSKDQIISSLVKQYKLLQKEAEKDFEEFIVLLKEKKIIE